MKNDPKPERRPVNFLTRSARIWATGPALGGRLILAHRMDDVIEAVCPTLYGADAPPGERRAVRHLLAARSAELRQSQLMTEWMAGAAGHDRWQIQDQLWAVEQALTAPKDRRLTRFLGIWPEGPPLVLCRHLYAEEDVTMAEPGTREWVDGRTPLQLVRSWVALGELSMGRL